MKNLFAALFLLVLASRCFAATDDGDEKKKPSAPADGPTEDQRRIERLEKELESLKAENAARKAGLPERMSLDQDKKEAPRTDEVEFKATFTDGFHIKSKDGNFDLHVGGRLLEEYRHTFNRHSDGTLRTSTNTFLVREAFISVDGTLFHDWGFKVNGDVSVPTGALIEEGWVEWRALKEFRLMFGSFKAPVSFEITDSPRFAKLIQRSPMARFQPNFDTGIKASGSLADTLFTYELAVTNGRSHLANTGRDQNDDNDGKEYDGRLTVAPFVQDKESILKGLRVGVYGSFAHVGQNDPNTGVQPAGWPGAVATNELAVTYLAAAAFPAAMHFHGDRYRVGGEFTYAVGPFMTRAEVLSRHDEVFTTGGKNNLVQILGYYVEMAFLLTGEDEVPNGRVVPKRPFSLSDGGWGAVELAARWGVVALDRKTLVDDGVAMAGNSNRVRSFTAGVNWWTTQNVRFCVDYTSEDYYSPIALSGSHAGRHVNGMLARFQVDF